MIGLARVSRLSAAIALICAFASAAHAQAPASRETAAAAASRQTTLARPNTVNRAAPVDYDARRAAAARLLLASRFRERQAVTIEEGIRVARLEMADECLQRAIDGANMRTCKAVTEQGSAMKARLAARQSSILDEVVAASQSVYARDFTVAEMDEITRFFKTPVGQRYGNFYPQLIADVQARKRAILRRYLTQAAAEVADRRAQ